MDRSLLGKAKLNAIANYAHFFLASLLTFFVSPVLAHSLGLEHFGIWKACQKYLSFASIADGRSTQALKWVIAKSEGEPGEHGIEKKQRAIGSALLVSLIFLPISLLVVVGIVYALPLLINDLEAGDVQLVRLLGLILGLNILFSPLFGVPDAILVGTNQAYRSTSIQMVWLAVTNCIVVALAYCGHGLVPIAGTFVVVALLNGATLYLICKKKVAWFGLLRPKKKQLTTFMSFSVWVLVWSFVARLLLSSEVLLIGSLIGAKAVAMYVFSSYIPQLAIAVCMMTCSSITPGLGALFGAKNFPRLKEIVEWVREVVYCLAIVFGGAILALNGAFVTLWVGPNYYIGDLPNVLMVILMIQLVLFRCEGQIQDITLKIHIKVLWGASGVLLGLLLGGLLYHFLAPELSSLFIGLFVGRCIISVRFPWIVNSFLQMKRSINLRFIIGMCLLYLCHSVSGHISSNGWGTLILQSIVIVAVLSVSSFILLLSQETRQQLIGKIKH